MQVSAYWPHPLSRQQTLHLQLYGSHQWIKSHSDSSVTRWEWNGYALRIDHGILFLPQPRSCQELPPVYQTRYAILSFEWFSKQVLQRLPIFLRQAHQSKLDYFFCADWGFEPNVRFPFLCLLPGPNVLLLPLLSYLYRNCQAQECH